MKTYDQFRKILLRALVMTTVFILLGCVARSKPQTTIYLTTQDENSSQLWKFIEPDGPASMLYELAKNPERTVREVFPIEELERLYAYPDTPSTTPLVPNPGIGQNLRLSARGNLVWKEGDMYCVSGAVGCFGVTRIMTLPPASREAQVLLQVPLRIDAGDFLYGSSPILSPDGQYLVTSRWVRNPVPVIVSFIQIETGKVTEIVGTVDTGEPFTWSPSSTSVAWHLSGRHTTRSRDGGSIRIYTLSTATHKDIPIDGLWVWGWGMEWSPNGKQIVLSAANKDPGAPSKEIKLYLLNPDTGDVQPIPVEVEGVLENPRWSPDGKLLAADLRPTVSDYCTSLLIIDPTTGEIVKQLAIERNGRIWKWDREGKNILLLLGTGFSNDSEHKVGIFNVEDSSLRILTLPEELATKQIRALSW